MGIPDVLSVTGTYVVRIFIPLLILHVGYTLWFHPLRKYPGPLLARLTNAYGAYFASRSKLHLAAHRNFQKYGSVVRQAPNRLVFNTITAMQDIYVNPKVTKGQSFHTSYVRSKYPSTISTIDKAQHQRKRKLIAPSLSERAMRDFEPIMISQITCFLQQILAASQTDSVVNISDRCKRLGIDIVGRLAFGYTFNTQVDDTWRYMYGLIEGLGWRLNTYMQFPSLKMFEWFLLLLRAKVLLKFDKAIKTIIKARMSQDVNAHCDLYSMVINQLVKEEKKSALSGELWPEAIFFISAGGMTTATAMSATFFYVAQSPTCYTKLATEIRSTFNSASEIRPGKQLASCKYLRACIDESMRLAPPSLFLSWRELDANEPEPFIVDGHVVPRGTQVAVNIYSILHNEDYFPDAFNFLPERWLDSPTDDGENEAKKTARSNMRKAFIPFSLGDRACAGRSMAYMEATITLARTLWFFDFEAVEKKKTTGNPQGRQLPEEYQLGDIFVVSHDGPNLKFRTRGDFWKEL